MKIIIVGAGEVGFHITSHLTRGNPHDAPASWKGSRKQQRFTSIATFLRPRCIFIRKMHPALDP